VLHHDCCTSARRGSWRGTARPGAGPRSQLFPAQRRDTGSAGGGATPRGQVLPVTILFLKEICHELNSIRVSPVALIFRRALFLPFYVQILRGPPTLHYATPPQGTPIRQAFGNTTRQKHSRRGCGFQVVPYWLTENLKNPHNFRNSTPVTHISRSKRVIASKFIITSASKGS